MATKKKTHGSTKKKAKPTAVRKRRSAPRKAPASASARPTSGPVVDRIIPHLIVNDGATALAFYAAAFGAEETERMTTPDGRLMHGELRFAGHRLFVSDEFSESEGGTCRAPHTLGGTGVRITLEVDDADAVAKRAVAAGALLLMPVADMFWGGRYGKVRDPFGHEWGLNQQVRALTAAEGKAATDAFFRGRSN
jgi:PhnB protein